MTLRPGPGSPGKLGGARGWVRACAGIADGIVKAA